MFRVLGIRVEDSRVTTSTGAMQQAKRDGHTSRTFLVVISTCSHVSPKHARPLGQCSYMSTKMEKFKPQTINPMKARSVDQGRQYPLFLHRLLRGVPWSSYAHVKIGSSTARRTYPIIIQ